MNTVKRKTLATCEFTVRLEIKTQQICETQWNVIDSNPGNNGNTAEKFGRWVGLHAIDQGKRIDLTSSVLESLKELDLHSILMGNYGR